MPHKCLLFFKGAFRKAFGTLQPKISVRTFSKLVFIGLPAFVVLFLSLFLIGNVRVVEWFLIFAFCTQSKALQALDNPSFFVW